MRRIYLALLATTVSIFAGSAAFAQAALVAGSVSTSNLTTLSYTVGAGNNRLVAIAISAKRTSIGTIGTINTVTFNGVAATAVVTQNAPAVTPTQVTAIYYLTEANIRAANAYCVAQTITVAWSAAPEIIQMTAMTFSDVDQTAIVVASASARNTGVTTTAVSGNIAGATANDIAFYASSSNALRSHAASAGYTEQSDFQLTSNSAATAIKVGAADPENVTATWTAGNSTVVIAGVVFNGIAATSTANTTYYTRQTGNWDDPNTWSRTSDGSTGALPAGVWPRRNDDVVIKATHNITVNAVDDNKICGLRPDDLGGNVGPFAGSNLFMFYQTGDVQINGTLTVSGIEIMFAGYTHVITGGAISASSSMVNVGNLEADAGTTLSSADDLCLAGNSNTTINTTSVSNDDLIISFTQATLCGTGSQQLVNGVGSSVTFSNSATSAQICNQFTITCSGTGCTGFPITGTGATPLGNTGPGGVGSSSVVRLWFRADALSQVNGSRVTNWTDQSGNGLNAVANTNPALDVTNQPGFVTNSINGLPSLSFDGGDYLTTGSSALTNLVPQTDPITFYGAVNIPTGNTGTFLSKAEGTSNRQYQFQTDGPNVFTVWAGGSFDNGTSGTATGSWRVLSAFIPAATTGLLGYINETAISFATTAIGTTTASVDVLVGARRSTTATNSSAFNINGNMAELVLYRASLSSVHRTLIANYFAAKYATAIPAGQDFYTMDNGGFGNYDFDVAGIGQAGDGSRHPDAKGSGIVRIWNPSGMSSGEFLIWGKDAGSITAGTIAGVDGTIIKERAVASWRVSELAGDVGTVNISFNTSTFPGTFLGSNLRLLIDRDADGFADNDVTPLAGTFANNTITFTGVNFNDDDIFTLGNTDNTRPLPIELSAFTAVSEHGFVVLDWATKTETNNDFFTIERSLTGKQWQKVADVPGAGNSTSELFYHAIDEKPFSGVSYYRLKQTDYDKHTSYSQVVKVTTESSDDVTVSPNPSSSTFIVDARFELIPEQIKVLDLMGRQIPVGLNSVGRTVVIDPGAIAPGVYFVQISNGLGIKTLRIVRK